ncbi:MAG: bifunctional nuclease family protein [Candidatus Neomarinimicrobiota bacterium]
MIRVALSKIIFYPPSKGYALLLKEIGGERQVPIIVGVFEAQSIALAIEDVKMPRPMTHDLFVNVIQKFSARINSVTVSDLVDGTFYAQIEIGLSGDKTLTIDARPSDAIALALRMKATILVAEEVMQEAGQYLSGKQRETIEKEEPIPEIQNLDRLFELQNQLQRAVEEENYELAAQLRDQISTLQRELNIN